jgi:hypothetical protein
LNDKLTAAEVNSFLDQISKIKGKYPEGNRCPICEELILSRAKWVLTNDVSICKSCHMSVGFNQEWCTGLELRKAREVRELSQVDVCKVLKWSQSYQSRLETRRVVWLTTSRSKQICALLPGLKTHKFELET